MGYAREVEMIRQGHQHDLLTGLDGRTRQHILLDGDQHLLDRIDLGYQLRYNSPVKI